MPITLTWDETNSVKIVTWIQADRDREENRGQSVEQNLRLAVEALGRKIPATNFELVSSFLWQCLHQVSLAIQARWYQ